jgi:uncharacterized integral membrane protein
MVEDTDKLAGKSKYSSMDSPASSSEQTTKPIQAHDDSSKRSRISTIWTSLAAFVVILIALLIFIAENSMTVKIHYFGAKGSIGFGVAMLLSAAAGIVLTLSVGSLRILQLKLKDRNK